MFQDAFEPTFVLERLECQSGTGEVGDGPSLLDERWKDLAPAAPRLVALVCDGRIAAKIDGSRGRVRHDERLKHGHVRLGCVRKHLKRQPPVAVCVVAPRRVGTGHARRKRDGLRLSGLHLRPVDGKPPPHELHVVDARPLARPKIDGDIVVPDFHRLVVRIRIELAARSACGIRGLFIKQLAVRLVNAFGLRRRDKRHGRRILETVGVELRRILPGQFNGRARIEVRALVARMAPVGLPFERIPVLGGAQHHVMRLDLLLGHLLERLLRRRVEVEKRDSLRRRELARRLKVRTKSRSRRTNLTPFPLPTSLFPLNLRHTTDMDDGSRKNRRGAFGADAFDEHLHVLRIFLLVAVALRLGLRRVVVSERHDGIVAGLDVVQYLLPPAGADERLGADAADGAVVDLHAILHECPEPLSPAFLRIRARLVVAHRRIAHHEDIGEKDHGCCHERHCCFSLMARIVPFPGTTPNYPTG